MASISVTHEILGEIFVLFAAFMYSCVLSCVCSVIFIWFVAVGCGGLLQSLATWPSCLHTKQLGLSETRRFCTVYHRNLLKGLRNFWEGRLG